MSVGFRGLNSPPPPPIHRGPSSHLASGVGVDEGGLQLSVALLGLDEGREHTVDPLPLVHAEGEIGALKRRHPAAGGEGEGGRDRQGMEGGRVEERVGTSIILSSLRAEIIVSTAGRTIPNFSFRADAATPVVPLPSPPHVRVMPPPPPSRARHAPPSLTCASCPPPLTCASCPPASAAAAG